MQQLLHAVPAVAVEVIDVPTFSTPVIEWIAKQTALNFDRKLE